ncbi:MAG: tRNA pseudouridine(55) synthase TruB [Chloroflexi bacterium]|nr:tRNA pseudouridine(55) synthase TruB [Chloroflexota bacterium]
MTSHDVVGIVRRASGFRRVGHAGTLDPSAEGVLLVCTGKATRVAQYLTDSRKVYCAEIVLGASTDTYDAEGRVVKRAPELAVTLEEVNSVLSTFVGKIEQVPPMYSAIKLAGQPLYKLARAGMEVQRSAREVEVYRAEITDSNLPKLWVVIECSKGTYVRSIAHDLGERLGCGAHLGHLIRLASGRFTLRDALTLSSLKDAFQQGWWDEVIYPLDEAILDLSAAILAPETQRAIINGLAWTPARWRLVDGQSPPTQGLCRAYSTQGEILALIKLDVQQSAWRPHKVFV